MALSPDLGFHIGRWVISEVRSSIPPSGEIYERDPTLAQVNHMRSISEVEITEEEASLYRALRKNLLDKTVSSTSDAALMAERVLTGIKSEKLKRAFPLSFLPSR